MADLYARLSEVGFPKKYVRESILPEWWADDLASYDFNRRIAEMAISRALKIPLAQLADAKAQLSLLGAEVVRFKRWQDAAHFKLLPAVAIARRVAELVLFCAHDLPALDTRGITAARLRETLLSGSQYITLQQLLDVIWDLGIPVFHLALLPDGAKRVDAMALLVEGRPCIALATSRSQPAWLFWPLAHELGHIAAGHLTGGDILDAAIELVSEIKEEKEANAFAFSLIYGDARIEVPQNAHPKMLAALALQEGEAARVLPECLVANFGFETGKWPVAQAALKSLQVDEENGHEQIRAALRKTISLDRLTEDDRHFFCRVTGLSE